jgi:hypothetical protein
VETNFKLAFADSSKTLDSDLLSQLTDLTSVTGKPQVKGTISIWDLFAWMTT